jgi:formaldehyde-activating enzyme involved in methanogenesis
MASRGETTGPRVDECRRALAFYRLTEAVAAEVERGIIPSEQADELVEHLTAVMT